MDFSTQAGVADTLSAAHQPTGAARAAGLLFAAPTHDSPPHRPLDPFFVLRVVRWRWKNITSLGAVGAVLALGLLAILPPAQVHTIAFIRVVPPEGLPGVPVESRDPRAQAELAKSPVVLRGALARPPASELASVRENPELAAARLAASLKVDVAAPQLLRLTLAGPDPRESAVLVRAVRDSFLREVATAEDERRKKRIEFLERAAEQCRASLAERRELADRPDGRVAFAGGAVGTNPDAGSKAAAVAQLEKMAGQITAELESLRIAVAVEKLAAPNPDVAEPSTPASSNRATRLALVVAVPFFLAFAGVVGREYVVRRVFTAADLPGQVRVLGTVPAAESPKDPLARPPAVDRIAAVVRHTSAASGGRVIAVTSAADRAGKAAFARQLAAALSAAGAKTLLIDADPHGGAVGRAFGLSGGVGLCDLVRGDAGASGGVRVGSDLFALSAGSACPVAERELTRGALRAALAEFRFTFDLIVIDAAPILASPLGLAAAQAADGVIVAVGCGVDREGPLRESLAALDAVNAPAGGVVVCGPSRWL